MIKFFRKIRQKLLSENRFSKYLIYALGEIILVVIGILIALQINVNEQNKSNQKKLDKYLSSLIEDLNKDKLSLLKCIEFDSTKSRLLNKYIGSGRLKLSNETFRYSALWKNFIVHKSTYQAIQSSNILELIDEVELQKAISEYYALAEQVNQEERNHLNTQMSNYTNEIIKRKRLIQFFSKINSNIELTTEEDLVFYGYFSHMKDIADYEVSNYNKLLKEIEKLSNLINLEKK